MVRMMALIWLLFVVVVRYLILLEIGIARLKFPVCPRMYLKKPGSSQ